MKDTIVYIFYTAERTLELCKYSFQQLGFENIIVIDGQDSFKDKYVRAARNAVDTTQEYFIRTDADRVVFDGLLTLLSSCSTSAPMWKEGQYYDYFMNRYRGGTPHIIPRKAMDILANDPSLMPNSNKPESNFSNFLKTNKLVDFEHSKILTNLHDFEQYPSKVCNTFINRLSRNHLHLYNQSHLESLPIYYKVAIQQAYLHFKENGKKSSMDFIDFSQLDEGFEKMSEEQIELTYDNLKNIYLSLCQKQITIQDYR